jgi:hypothetical protein
MKRLFAFGLFCVLIISGVKATDVPVYRDPIPPGPVPLAMDYLPVSVTIDESNLSLFFDSSVGDATITVYDSSNNVVYQEVVDTDSTAEVFIPVTSWSAGDYTVRISYGTTNLVGYFQIP